MNPNYAPKSRRGKIVTELLETTALPLPKAPRANLRDASEMRSGEPKWENLTLDELKSWLEEAKRQQAAAE